MSTTESPDPANPTDPTDPAGVADAATADVLVVGGGPAGLSAAVALSRSLRRVIVVDAGHPRNAPADGAHNVLGQEGVPPLELLAAGRREAEGYGARFLDDRAVTARRADDGFQVTLATGGVVRARRLLLATGLADGLPDLPGVREHWGRSVLHCPYCHGWEVRGRRIAVLGTGPHATHQAQMFRQLSEDVTLLRHTMPAPDEDTLEQLSARGIAVVDGPVARLLDGEDGALRAVLLEDGTELPADAVVVGPRFVARAELYEQLGGSRTDHPLGSHIAVDAQGRTGIDGVWAAGNTADLAAMVTVASAAGLMAGAALNADLIAEETAAAVRAARAG
ncbi:NAD(P)/FAD-dependent oxidoreductase [Streptomyces abyssomicinicus]|uniref:NAD(P)/FAD-dependent oxidoreductase n=1 Tax=Streptomyces abyssomicinicus TaxID=574929 RepID=UPI0012507C0F|nr:NAD(P)/FAD-dependent oxidoreductase [Streptomyces abyssomicinicus]